jgi:hypothetical protein
MPLFGGGPIQSIEHRHFWKVTALFVVIVGGIWAWHYFKIRHDVRQENTQQFQAQQTIAPKGSVLPKTR